MNPDLKLKILLNAKFGINFTNKSHQQIKLEIYLITNMTGRMYEDRIISESKSNQNAFQAYIKKRTKKSGDITALKNEDGDLSYDEEINAQQLNKYFASVFVDLLFK